MHAARAAVARGELRGGERQLELQEQHAHLGGWGGRLDT